MNPSVLSRWWKSVLLVSLCALVLRGPAGRSALRTTEARLSGFDAWRPCTKQLPKDGVVEVASCGPVNLSRELVSLTPSECYDRMKTSTHAVELLALVDQCTDVAVERLEALAGPRPDAAMLSDLAGAYYIRAQRKDQPSDLIRSLAAADRAVDLQPSLTSARFNRALAEEALGLSDDAIATWEWLRTKDSPEWATEAGEHHERLLEERSRAVATTWLNNKKRLPEVVSLGDPKAVEDLVAPYHRAAQLYLEDEVLPAWALASKNGLVDEAARQLTLAEMIASTLARLEQDRYLFDGVDRIRTSRYPGTLASLQDGHLALQSARGLGATVEAELSFKRAEGAFKAAGSSFRFGAAFGRVSTFTLTNQYDRAAEELHSLEREAAGRYPSVRARIHAGWGFLRMMQGLDFEGLAEYQEARSIFEHANDRENAGSCQSNIIGLYRRIGHTELTWRAIFEAERTAGAMVSAQSRHSRLGEKALATVALGYPEIALRYQNLAVRVIEEELQHAQGAAVFDLRRHRGIAFLFRAGIRLHLQDRIGAQSDLAVATRLIVNPTVDDRDLVNGFRARILEFEAQEMARSDRNGAIARISEAIRLVTGTRYDTLTPSLWMQRAEWYGLDGNRAAMAADLERAVTALRAQETAALQTKKKVATGLLWPAYFSRAQEAYRRLITLYVEGGGVAKAFGYAERARAYEPLHLVLGRDDVPPSFRELIRDGEPLDLQQVEQILPPGTVLLQYAVLDARTCVWVVSKGRSALLLLPVGEKQIREWTRGLQRFAALRDDRRFEGALVEPYKALLEKPLALVAQSGLGQKLVIVPDRSMHGLPFSALSDGKRLLIEDYAVSVAGSASLYAFSLARDRELSDGGRQAVRLFADPAFNRDLKLLSKLPGLTGARREAQRIAEVYSAAADVLPPIMGSRATVPELIARSAESTILHLALHGVANPDVPPRSFLLLAPTAGESGAIDADRLLTQLQLKRTRLAVLSACSSAGGTPVGPEGLAPLVRPFIAAGVPGVVGTLWSVSDDTATEDLLVRFHQLYRDGHAADEALRQAQHEMLKSARLTHPVRAWAAFQLVGHASSPFPVSAGSTRSTK